MSTPRFFPPSPESEDETENMDHPFPPPPESVDSNTTKREYALLELLRSERTYVRDLVLLRDYQVPLASGRLSSMSGIWPALETTIYQYLGLGPPVTDTDIGPSTTSAASSENASRPLTTASNISAVSLASIFTLRPMKTKDVNIVFANSDKLAAFSEEFLHQLESALGELVEGNEGQDYVGRLFLESISQMEPLYRTYIMNQHRALEHYHRLSKTFQFDIYFPRSQILAHKSSNAWDLPSLLIKPVQRLLHYPQLLAAIIAETPETHSDKAALVKAHARIAELARGLNTQWRQQKVVRDVLASAGLLTGSEAVQARKKGGLKVGLPTSVSLGRIIGPRPGVRKTKPGQKENGGLEGQDEAKVVKAMGGRLNEYPKFMEQFMAGAVNWADAMRAVVGALEGWAKGFESVIWLDDGVERSEAFRVDVFWALISDQWLAACDKLKTAINEEVLRSVVSLRSTTVGPIRLLEAMQSLEPLHYDLLALPAGKSRPPSQLVEASESYLALHAQLAADLPTYIVLLDKGLAACIRTFAHIQWAFYSEVRRLWRLLWDSVKSDREANKGAAETLRVWWNRFHEVHAQIESLNIAHMPTPRKDRVSSGWPYINGGQATRRGTPSSVLAILDALDVPVLQRSPSDSARPRAISSASTSTSSSIVRPAITSRPRRKTRSGGQIPSLYECRIVHPCEPPEGVEYRDLPFFTLVVGEVYEIMQEAGHPSAHRDLPLDMDDGEDCLLLARNGAGDVGWALASFMEPVD